MPIILTSPPAQIGDRVGTSPEDSDAFARRRVLISDDHPVVRRGYRHFLLAHSSNLFIGEAASASETFEQLASGPWHLLLLDIGLPDRSSLYVLREVCRTYPRTRVLVVSGLPEDYYAPQVLREGAHGFVSKSAAAEEFALAVRCVFANKRYESPRSQQRSAQHGGPLPPREETLSLRESYVLQRMAQGAPLTLIARELDRSVKTVSCYRHRVMQKMGFISTADFTQYAVRTALNSETSPHDLGVKASLDSASTQLLVRASL